MKAAGWWTWWNQYGSVPLGECVERARRTAGVIVKANYWPQMELFRAAGIPVAVERYVYPTQPLQEAAMLAEGIRRGALFAVINAEVEWEQAGSAGGAAMTQLIEAFRRAYPHVELYASVDTRGGRMLAPYQQVLKQHVAGWMPMIYPKAFGQSVERAFAAALDGSAKDFGGKPVLPTFQTYDGIGSPFVHGQMAEVRRRELLGGQAYTVGHATGAEWDAFLLELPTGQAVRTVTPGQLLTGAGVFARATLMFAEGDYLLTDELRAQIKFLARV